MLRLVIYTSMPVGEVELIANKLFPDVEFLSEFESPRALHFAIGSSIVSMFDLEALLYDLKEFDFDITSTCIQVVLWS